MVYAVRTRSQTEGRSLCKSNYRVTTDSGMFCRVILLCLRVPLQACEALPREKTEEQESVTYPYATLEKRPLSGVKRYLMPRSGSPSETHAA